MHCYVLYNPAKLDFVRNAAGKPVATAPRDTAPKESDKPAGTPPGCYFMQATDEDDTRYFKFNPTIHERGEPEFFIRGGAVAIRSFPIMPKKK